MENDRRMTDTRTLAPLLNLKAFSATIARWSFLQPIVVIRKKTAAVLRKSLSSNSLSCVLLQPLRRFADIIIVIAVVVGIVFLPLGSGCIHRSAARTKYTLTLRKSKCTKWKLTDRRLVLKVDQIFF